MKKVNLKISLTALVIGLMVSCGGNENRKQSAEGTAEAAQTGTKAEIPKGNDYADTKAFSVKYIKDGDIYIVTTSTDEKRRRLDHITADGTHNAYIALTDEENNTSGLCYEDGRWDDKLTAITKINGFTLWKSLHLYYKDAGFIKKGNVTVCGAQCVLWAGTQKDMRIRYADLPMDQPAEIAVWNNKVTIRLKSGNNVISEAKAFSANVPETAFTQTTETSWIE